MSLLDSLDLVLDYQARVEEFSSIPGWLSTPEGYALLTLAERGPGEGEVVEIGSYAGLSTTWLAYGTRRSGRGKVTAIDHFRGSPPMQKGGAAEVSEIVSEGSTYRVFAENIQRMGLGDQVVPLIKSSADAARDWSLPIRLLFIDGEHTYEAARLDFEAFESVVVPGGIVCFHDVGQKEGVSRFFEELLRTRPEYKHIKTVVTLAILVKHCTSADLRGPL